ncbi:U1 snRNP protein [Coemansia thaxteri]|nr:U1 snRNP protein [Coemansia thaxteri]KAJ2473423.1 U1 snRNP protein [Coemansia sp. RSA 2322]
MARREFRTHQEAEQAFFDLLLAHKVGSDWTWEQTLREIASDPDYRSLKSLQERKDAFYKYTDKLREREQEEKRERAKQQRDNFFAMLKDMPISQVTRFRKIKHLAAEHPAFIAAGRESERLFGEFMDEFIRETKERRRAVRNEAMHKLSEHFVGLSISAKWSDVKAELLHKFSHLLMPALRAPADPSAVPVDTPYMLGSEADPEAGLCMLDFMDAFERAIADAEKREAEERQREKDGILGSQRQRRDGFRQLLEEHNSWFTPSSTWTQFYPLIKADPRYIEILGQPGSTPLELFWDKVELLDEDVYRERKRLEAAMHEHGFRVHTGTTIDEVKKFVADTCSITDSYLDYIFEQVLMKARRKKEEEDERLQRQRCRLMDDFKYALLDLSPALDARSTWEVDKGRIARLPEYRDLADEAAGREVFGRIIEREKEKELASAAQYSRDLESHKRLRSSPEVASPPGGRIVRPRTGSRGNASSNARHSPTHHASSGNVHNEGHDSELEEGEMVV